MSVKFSKSLIMKQNLLVGSPQTVLVTKEGLSMNVSTILLKMFSSHMTSLLSLPPCVSTAIILPDFSLYTLSNLIEIINKGYSVQCKDILESRDTMEKVLNLAEVMGINMETLDFGMKQSEVVNIKNDVYNQCADNSTDDGRSLKTEFGVLLGNIIDENHSNGFNENRLLPQIVKISDSLQHSLSTKSVYSIKEVVKSSPSKTISEEKNNASQIPDLLPKLQNVDNFICENKKTNSLKNTQIFPPKKKKMKSVGTFVKLQKFKHLTIKKESKPRMKYKKRPKIACIETSTVPGSTITENSLPPGKSVGEIYNKRKQYKGGVKLISECQVCNKSFEAQSVMIQHLVVIHFYKEIKETFVDLYEGSKCLICDKTNGAMVLHIGATHRKINEVLLGKGLKPIPSKVKKCVEAPIIKQEINEEQQSHNVVNGNAETIEHEETSTDSLDISFQEQPNPNSLADPGMMASIDQILAKYAIN